MSNHFGADFNRTTYLAAIELFHNYELEVSTADNISSTHVALQDEFIDACMRTAVIRELHAFVLQKGLFQIMLLYTVLRRGSLRVSRVLKLEAS